MTKIKLLVASTLLAGLIAGAASALAVEQDATAAQSQLLLGAYPAPPMGPGPGKLTLLQLPGGAAHVVDFGSAGAISGNSFYLATDGDLAFVPSVAGITYVIAIPSGKQVRHFNTIHGGRVAAVSPDHKQLFVLSGNRMAAYSTQGGDAQFEVEFGGNALAFNADGSRLFVGGNMNKTIAEIDTATGKILRQIPIGHSGDLVWAHGLVFSADMQNGVITAFDPTTDRTYTMQTPEVDSTFSYAKIPAANAGFMQLAVSPDQQYVYAAGFSGNILRFSTQTPKYLGEVAVADYKSGPNKLSGLAILSNGLQAITTVENRHESVIVDLSTGTIVKRLPKVASNRWVLVSFNSVHKQL
jgi:DNA-binding beta-propeller fold protein YncE